MDEIEIKEFTLSMPFIKSTPEDSIEARKVLLMLCGYGINEINEIIYGRK